MSSAALQGTLQLNVVQLQDVEVFVVLVIIILPLDQLVGWGLDLPEEVGLREKGMGGGREKERTW